MKSLTIKLGEEEYTVTEQEVLDSKNNTLILLFMSLQKTLSDINDCEIKKTQLQAAKSALSAELNLTVCEFVRSKYNVNPGDTINE